MKLMKRLLPTFFIALPIIFSTLTGCSSIRQGDKEEVAATVNDTDISMVDLQATLDNLLNQYRAVGLQFDSTRVDSLRNHVLESMIASELLYQESQKEGFLPSDEEIDREIELIVSQYTNEQIFKDLLEKQGLSEEVFRKQVTQNVAIRNFVEERVANQIVVPIEEKVEFYETHKEEYKHEEQVAAKHIVIQASKNEPPDSLQRKKELLEDLRARIIKGEDFSDIAKQYSEGPSSSRGGELGYFSRGQMVKPFEDTAFSLKKGEVSDVILTQFGYHIIFVYDKREAGTSSFQEVEESIEDQLKRQRVNQELDSLVQKLREEADIEILI